MPHYDAIILGSGPGGYRAAELLADAGMHTALIERADVGGTCLNIGCIPTKTLLNSAKLYTHARESAAFGIVTEQVRVDWDAVRKWKETVVQKLRRSLESTLTKAGVEIVRGSGMLKGPGIVEVLPAAGGEAVLLEAPVIIVATGSAPVIPPIPGLAGNPAVKDSTAMLNLESIPQKLCIIGGGVIGIEFASLYSALGSQVTVIEMLDEIVPVMEPRMAAMLRMAMKQVTFLRGTKVVEVKGSTVSYEAKDGARGTLEADTILLSVGRRAVIEGWGAEQAGLEIKNRAIAVDDRMRTNIPGIWAIGDVTGKSQLAHAAYRMAEVAAADIIARRDGRQSVQRFVAETVPWALYSIPEAAGCGLTETEAKARGYDVAVFSSPYGVSGRFIAENGFSSPGSIRIVTERTSGRVLGVHLLGAYASEQIWGAALALEQGATLAMLRDMVFPHPTVSEVIREAAWTGNPYHKE